MKLIGTTASLAFVYSFLLTAALGLLIMPFDIDVGIWGVVFWISSFFVLLWPAFLLAKKVENTNTD